MVSFVLDLRIGGIDFGGIDLIVVTICCCFLVGCREFCSRVFCIKPNWRRMARSCARIGHRPGSFWQICSCSFSKILRKSCVSYYCVTCMRECSLIYFSHPRSKHAASSISSTSTTNKLELCVDLNGAVIEWAAVKSSRKGVFQVSTLLGVQLLLHDEDETNAVVWFDQIRRAISRLPCSRKGWSMLDQCVSFEWLHVSNI